MKKMIYRFLKIYLLILLFIFGAISGLFYYYSKELPPLSELQRFDMKVGSEVYDKHDNLIHVFSIEKRKLTNINELPDYLVNALIATEDKNFYDHWGMDLLGLARAIIVDLKHFSFSQGASTITQQLARNMFLSLDKQIPRKIKELLLAVQIESHYSKEEIIEFYLNKAPFGPGLYGVEVASQRYFNKEAKYLTITEAALLAGMPQLPSGYYPYRHPKRAKKRRNIVLKRMLIEEVITQKEYNEAIKTEIVLIETKQNYSSADYFIEHIRKILEKKYGTTKLFASGMKIYTTIDMDLQTYADTILNKKLTAFENKNDYEIKYEDFPADTTDIITDYVQAGAITIENETGYVNVLIGGRNFNHSKFNRMTQSRRQPGSSFKPILYSTALMNGYTLSTIINDEPISFIQNDTLFWQPHNYSQKNFGYTRMRNALKKSRNVYAVKMIYDLEPKKVRNLARQFGITTPISPFYSLAIGTSVVYPYQMIAGYTTFANNGERTKPIFIRRVEDHKGKILETAKIEKIRVLDEKIAFLIRSMMQSVIDEGTGMGVRWQQNPACHYRWTAAGKTGTTDDYRDAWFLGYNKKYVTGIWVGFDDYTTLGTGQTGANAALPSWPYIMKKAIELDSPLNSKGKPIIDGSLYKFDKPDGIVNVAVSKETGLLPKSSLEETIDEYFIAGTQPNPLSDSLDYNFFPTFYREHEQDSLVFDLGGNRFVWPDTTIWVETIPDTTLPDSILLVPKEFPEPIDLRGALIIKNKKIETRSDTLLFN